MTRKSEEGFVCPVCGHPGKGVIYDSINITLDPQLKEGILDGTLFDLKCENCGEVLDAPEELIYHDMDQQTMFFLQPVGLREKWPEITEQFQKLLATHMQIKDLFDADTEEYTYRVCFGRPELLEKIFMLDAGLDDRQVEMIKLLFFLQNREQFPGLIPEILFAGFHEKDKWGLACYDRDSKEFIGTIELERRVLDDEISAEADEILEILTPPYVNYMKYFDLFEEEDDPGDIHN